MYNISGIVQRANLYHKSKKKISVMPLVIFLFTQNINNN